MTITFKKRLIERSLNNVSCNLINRVKNIKHSIVIIIPRHNGKLHTCHSLMVHDHSFATGNQLAADAVAARRR